MSEVVSFDEKLYSLLCDNVQSVYLILLSSCRFSLILIIQKMRYSSLLFSLTKIDLNGTFYLNYSRF